MTTRPKQKPEDLRMKPEDFDNIMHGALQVPAEPRKPNRKKSKARKKAKK